MKKVLIIGSQGMLGQELFKVFAAQRRYSVTAWDLPDIDITDETQVEEKISRLAPQIIINAAAFNDVDGAEEPDRRRVALMVNGYAPGFLAREARKLDALFVHYSSDYVFDGEYPKGYWEHSATNPVSHYGESKLEGENRIKENCDKYYIIRLQKLFGPSGKSGLAKKSFFSKMLDLAEKQEEIKVVDSELSNFTYAPDLARRTKYLIEHELPWGIYHITNEGRPVTWFGGARILFDLAGKQDVILVPVSPEKFKRPAMRPRFIILRNSKLKPMRPWPKALKEFLKI